MLPLLLPGRTLLRAAVPLSLITAVGTVLIAATRYVSSPQAAKAPPPGPRLQTLFDFVGDLAADRDGGVYVLEPSAGRVRKLTADGVVTTVVGGRDARPAVPKTSAGAGQSGPPILFEANSIAVDPQGRLYIADRLHVWKVARDGSLVRVAGTTRFQPPDKVRKGDRATEVGMEPTALAADGNGNLYIAETGRILKVDARGILTSLVESAPTPHRPSLVSHRNFQPRGMAVDSSGNLYVADPTNHTVSKVTPQGSVIRIAGIGKGSIRIDGDVISGRPGGDGRPATEAQLFFPHDVAVDAGGNLYIAEMSTRIRKVDARGIITSLEIRSDRPADPEVNRGFPRTMGEVRGITVDGRGNLYAFDSYEKLIWKREPRGRSEVVAGRPWEVREEVKLFPRRDQLGGYDSVISDGWSPEPVRVNGAEFTFRTAAGKPGGEALEPEKDVPTGFSFRLMNQSDRDRIYDLSTVYDCVLTDDAGREIAPAERRGPKVSLSPLVLAPGQEVLITIPVTVQWAAADALLSISFADISRGSRIYPLPRGGTYHLSLRFRATGAVPAGLPLSVRPEQVWRGSVTVPLPPFRFDSGGEGRTATGPESPGGNGPVKGAADETAPVEVVWENLVDLAVDRRGNAYVLEYIRDRYRLWRCTPRGRITLMGEDPGVSNPEAPAVGIRLNMPRSLAVDASDRLYIAEGIRVRRWSPDGTLEILAGRKQLVGDRETDDPEGKPARLAVLGPSAITVDSRGTLYIAEANRPRLWKVDSGGILRRVAGTGERGVSGDGGPAVRGELSAPTALAADGQGNVYVSDYPPSRNEAATIRRIGPDGILSTVVTAPGPYGFGKLAADGAGNLYYADLSEGKVWRRSPGGETLDVTKGVTWRYLFKRPVEEVTPKIRLAPMGLALDASGGVLILDQNEHCLWKLTPRREAVPLVGSERTFFSDLSYNNYEIMREYPQFRAYPPVTAPVKPVDGVEVRAAASHVFDPPNVPASETGDVASANLMFWLKNGTAEEKVIPLDGVYRLQLLTPEGGVLEPEREKKTAERPLLLAPGQDALVRFRANLWRSGEGGRYLFRLDDGLGNRFTFGPLSLGRYALRFRLKHRDGETDFPTGKTPVWRGEAATEEIPLKFYERNTA